MLEGAKLTMSADVDDDGSDETGVFVLDGNIDISPFIRTGDLIGPTGQTVGAIIQGGDRGGFRLDFGGGALGVNISSRNWEGSSHQWGDGTTNDAADATGDGVFRQLSVLIRYLDRGTYDSRNAATFEWGEYSNSGEYSAMSVTPEEPRVNFNAGEDTSIVTLDMDLISTRSISQASISQDQDES